MIKIIFHLILTGCYYETTDVWGTIYTPGYTGNINYPSSVSCEWKITTNVPVTFYFDSNSRLQSNDYNRDVNGDFLKVMMKLYFYFKD
jgi:hypothetical protein